MKIIISRHGEAEPFSATGFDEDRSLTESGKNDIIKMSYFIKQTPLIVDKIFHSPFKRTKQTADMYAEYLNPSIIPIASSCLLPTNEYSDICLEFTNLSNSNTVLVVGHNPDIAYFSAKLIKDFSLNRNFIFSPGSTIAINVPKENFRNGQILWMVSPEYLR